MKQSKVKYEIDMCNGPLLGKILLFFLPLMLSGILQLLFNAADIVVVGRFAGKESLAAVGSTSALINLIINVFIGMSAGTNVLTARYYGANQQRELKEMVHTAIATALFSGVALILIGNLVAKPALLKMGTPDDVIGYSVLYMRIYFVGMPAMMCYNFGAAILNAVGDTRRPLYYLLFAGVINVILNLFFVIILHLGVAGVALATVFSQCISALLVILCLMKSDGDYKIVLKELKIYKDKLFKMLRIGIPAGLQGALFSISNVLIQSSINSFGPIAMAGNTAAGNIEGFVYTSMNALHQTTVNFVSQNYGANKANRIKKILLIDIILVFLVGLILGNFVAIMSPHLIGIYNNDLEVISYGVRRLKVIGTIYFLCGIMDVIVGAIRGMGYSVMPMIVSLTGVCLYRVYWIFVVFQKYHTLEVLYYSYPISWIATSIVHFICFLVIMSIFEKRLKIEQ